MFRPDSARFSVAPMMDWTDSHCRALHRILTRRARLYTEMVTADAVLIGPRERLIGFERASIRSRCSSAARIRRSWPQAARIGADFGYDEVNLNVGCPSDRVQSGRFGACLMKEPALVADCVAAMGRRSTLPVTVKCRIGVDDQDPREALYAFAGGLAAGAAALSSMRARPGSKACRPRRIAKCRRSITTWSTRQARASRLAIVGQRRDRDLDAAPPISPRSTA